MSATPGQVAALLRDAGPLAPPALRERVEAEAEAKRKQRRPALSVFGFAVAGAAASLLIAFALFGSGLLGDDPTAVEAHGLSARGPDGPAPPVQAQRPELLAAELDGVAFPRWEPEFGWRAYAGRSDELGGRETETVFYEHEGHSIAYTIVSGDPLEAPQGARHVERNGVELATARDDHGHDIVVFERGGKTCVLSGHVEHRSTLLELAAWQGGGRVGF
jgi:hypothetical protein